MWRAGQEKGTGTGEVRDGSAARLLQLNPGYLHSAMREGGTTPRRRELVVFGLFGVLLFAGILVFEWLFVLVAMEGRVSWWIRLVQRALLWSPWAIGLALFGYAVIRKRWIPLLGFAGGQIVGVVCLVLLMILGPVAMDYGTCTRFESTAWKAENRRGAEGVRVRMVDDLLSRHSLVGMDRRGVDELLGVPPQSDYFPEYDYVYWLGPERGLISIDSEWLVLKFDGEKVTLAKVVRD